MSIAAHVDVNALLQEGRTLLQCGKLAEARPLCEQALRLQPDNFFALYLLGVVAYQSGHNDQAVDLIGRALRIDPGYAKAHNHLGNALIALGQFERAVTSYTAALALEPTLTEAHCNLGNAQFDMGQFHAAIDSFDRAIAGQAAHTLAYLNRGLCQLSLERYDAAIADFDVAIALDADSAEAHNYRGHALRESGDLAAALESYARAISLRSDYAEAHNARGSVLAARKEFAPALRSYEEAIRQHPGFAAAHLNRGNVLKELRRWDEAIDSFDLALGADGTMAEAHLNRGNVLKDRRRWQEALASYDRAIAVKPDLAEAYYARGNTLHHLGRYELALADLDVAAALKPDLDFLQGLRRHIRMGLCDWNGVEADLAEITMRIERGEAASPPFPMLALTDSPELQKRAAEIWVRETCPPEHVSVALPQYGRHDKIRLGYFSADFRNHPVSYLTVELFEMHDRSQFEVSAFSLRPAVDDDMVPRLRAAFDRFVDVGDRSESDIAQLARKMELDIAVDLGGFTEGGNPKVFANRAAPLQLGYLGYLGTSGAPYMDYMIADAATVPEQSREFYSEKIIYLPCFQANDSQRHVAERAFDRKELGLPTEGFVFCCFNSHYKITPDTFSTWMRILNRVRGSVLLMHVDIPVVEDNLRAEAQRRGVDPARLVFGGRLSMPEYLARYRTADLFLDTLPYNAGTTASDALWAGLPVLTCMGSSMAGRVAGSLLTAVGLSELITTTREQYESLAVKLAQDPALQAEIKRKLRAARAKATLFDTKKFAASLESGYAHIYKRYLRGLPPEHVVVPASG